jgi:hypothetical protein
MRPLPGERRGGVAVLQRAVAILRTANLDAIKGTSGKAEV